MSRVCHFEIPTDDPERCIAFFSQAFGWEITKWDGPVEYWLVSTGDESEPGIHGGLMRRQDASETVMNTIAVESVDASIERITAAGGAIVLPKTAIPGVGWMAYFRDPDGHIHGIMSQDPSAA